MENHLKCFLITHAIALNMLRVISSMNHMQFTYRLTERPSVMFSLVHIDLYPSRLPDMATSLYNEKAGIMAN